MAAAVTDNCLQITEEENFNIQKIRLMLSFTDAPQSKFFYFNETEYTTFRRVLVRNAANTADLTYFNVCISNSSVNFFKYFTNSQFYEAEMQFLSTTPDGMLHDIRARTNYI